MTVNINLRLPPTLHATLKQQAGSEGISLNTLILLLLTQALSSPRDAATSGGTAPKEQALPCAPTVPQP